MQSEAINSHQNLSSHDKSTNSLSLIYAGNSEEFIRALKYEITQHPALNHPFLLHLQNGDFRDTTKVLRDYGHQYSFYSQWFTRYLDGVISNLSSQEHKETLLQNMEEERGIPESTNKEDLPHVEIFKLFKHAVGATDDYCSNTTPCTTALLWRELFLQKCSSNIPGVGIAAIGLATEGIISTIYPYIINAINNHTNLDNDASLFFKLHVDCDDGHAESLEEITQAIAEDKNTREAIRFGVFSSLNLRSAFWDAQLARALNL